MRPVTFGSGAASTAAGIVLDRNRLTSEGPMVDHIIIDGRRAELTAAILRLWAAGWSVRSGDKPGLTYVGGRLLTVPQILSLASHLAT